MLRNNESLAQTTMSVLQDTLTHHIAKKSIPCIDEKGNKTKTAGMKLELFIFDILQFASVVHSYYASRSEEVRFP